MPHTTPRSSSHARPRFAGVRSLILPLLAIGGLVAVMAFSRGGGGGLAPTPAYFDKALTLASANDKSTASGKPVFVFVTADWCPPCQALKRDALADPKVAEAVSTLTVPLYVDATNTVPDDVASLGISGFPTVILLQDGKQLGRFTGNTSASNVLAFVEQARK
jgi:thiol:disulfide interchange protein